MTFKISAGNYTVAGGYDFNVLNNWLEDNDVSQVFVFTDENTNRHCLPVFKKYLSEKPKPFVEIETKSGEQNKNIQTTAFLWEKLTQHHADRHSLVINLAGGVLCDMGGFAAATYKRGIRFIQVPTTLLSMVDASVGGKTGIDLSGYKNQVGLFAEPSGVFIFPPFLDTLPMREFRSGLAEMLKHGLIADDTYFDNLIKFRQNDMKHEDMAEFIQHSVEIKNNIVSEDPTERGLRKVLNFGHTAGHAFETYFLNTKTPLLHGEAVACGMVVETLLSQYQIGLPIPETEKIIKGIKNHFVLPELSEKAIHELAFLMRQDKKNKAGKVNFTLIKNPGKPVYDTEIEVKLIVKALGDYNTLL
ncbi:MAG: 3-dehydroquinate synthase [Bacteroidota bacterium]